MGPLSTLRQIFTLDTLDTRLTAKTRSSSPPKSRNAPSLSVQNAGESSTTRRIKDEANPSLWNTPEFYVYYVVFAIAVPMMFKVAHDVSKGTHLSRRSWRKL